MPRLIPLALVAVMLVITWGCGAKRMAPFAPHRADTDFHRQAITNQACIDCHEVAKLRVGHQESDNCLRCHRILHGDL